ncbi:MAG: penicillin-binding transpeptidase domain-containing protein [Kiritimatiellaeota bacterium]|nr:penicillin-binding transpeptidase domain-containing protein [Kiritimatiellota bacterium]
MRWLRSLGMNTASLHISLGILTPFIIYTVAEWLHMSGILAVFCSGIFHSLYWDKFNPEVVSLNKAQESVWSVVSFSLDGLVFVMLGTQLPHILRTFASTKGIVQEWLILVYILLLSVLYLAIRTAWWFFLVNPKYYNEPDKPISKLKSSFIFGVAGAHGAVTMAILLSIPLFLPGGAAFPERDFIILIASGVIVVSMSLTNFVLPLLADEPEDESLHEMEQAALSEILHTVVERLKEAETPENYAATEIVMRNFISRMNQHMVKDKKDKKAHWDILHWEKDVVLHLAEINQISKNTAERYIEEVDRLIASGGLKRKPLRLLIWTVRQFIASATSKDTVPKQKDITKIKKANNRLMRERMKALRLDKDDPALAIIAAEHEQVVSSRLGLSQDADNAPMLNRATDGLYPPGSTFKIVAALCALESGMRPVFDCPAEGFMGIRDSDFYAAQRRGAAWGGFGKIGLAEAFVHSSNVYFSQLAVALGGARLEAFAETLRLEDRWIYAAQDDRVMQTARGKFPALRLRREQAQAGIGQGAMAVTPLHVAMWTGVVANNGVLWQPRLLATEVGRGVPSAPVRVASVSSAREVAGFMREAVARGTGRHADVPGLDVCGKTGTAQTGHGADHAWFTCFAPRENPQIIVTVLIERGGFGGSVAAPVARAILEEAARLGIVKQTAENSNNRSLFFAGLQCFIRQVN